MPMELQRFNLSPNVSVLGMLKKHMHSRTRTGESPTQFPTPLLPLVPTSVPIHNPKYRVFVRLSDISPADTTAGWVGSDFCGTIHALVAGKESKEMQMPRSPIEPNKNLDCCIGKNSWEMFENLGSGRSYALNRRIGAIETNLRQIFL